MAVKLEKVRRLHCKSVKLPSLKAIVENELRYSSSKSCQTFVFFLGGGAQTCPPPSPLFSEYVRTVGQTGKKNSPCSNEKSKYILNIQTVKCKMFEITGWLHLCYSRPCLLFFFHQVFNMMLFTRRTRMDCHWTLTCCRKN